MFLCFDFAKVDFTENSSGIKNSSNFCTVRSNELFFNVCTAIFRRMYFLYQTITKNAENFSTKALVVKQVPFANWWCALTLWQTKADVTNWLKFQNCWPLPTLTDSYWRLLTDIDSCWQLLTVADSYWRLLTLTDM